MLLWRKWHSVVVPACPLFAAHTVGFISWAVSLQPCAPVQPAHPFTPCSSTGSCSVCLWSLGSCSSVCPPLHLLCLVGCASPMAQSRHSLSPGAALARQSVVELLSRSSLATAHSKEEGALSCESSVHRRALSCGLLGCAGPLSPAVSSGVSFLLLLGSGV